MLTAIDRPHFSLASYTYHSGAPDEFTRSLLNSFDTVIDVSAMPDAEAVALIRRDAPDVLIDIDLYANGARPTIPAARCAPLQLSSLGCLTTAGAPSLDAIIADDLTIPTELENAYDERILHAGGAVERAL